MISPLLANIYLHHVLDAWFEEVVKPWLRGEAYEVRFADDFIFCFQYREEAEKVLEVLTKRFAKYGLTLHSDKTRLIEFGRKALARSEGKRGKKPATFDFLGFTHICKRSRRGYFTIHVRTMQKRLRRSLKALSCWCQEHRHDPVEDQCEALNRKLRGPQNLEELAESADSGKDTELDGLRAAPESSPADATPHRALLDPGLSPGPITIRSP